MSVPDVYDYDQHFYPVLDQIAQKYWPLVEKSCNEKATKYESQSGDLSSVAIKSLLHTINEECESDGLFPNLDKNPVLYGAFVAWATIKKTVAAGAEISVFDILLADATSDSFDVVGNMIGKLCCVCFFTKMHLGIDIEGYKEKLLKPEKRKLPAPHFALKGGRRLSEAVFHRFWDAGDADEVDANLDDGYQLLECIFNSCMSDDNGGVAFFPLHVACYTNIGFRRWAEELKHEQIYGNQTEKAVDFALRLADFTESYILQGLTAVLNEMVTDDVSVQRRSTALTGGRASQPNIRTNQEEHQVKDEKTFYGLKKEEAKVLLQKRLAVMLMRDCNGETVIGLAIKSGNASLAGRFLSLAREQSYEPDNKHASFIASIFSHNRTDELARCSELSSILLHRDREGDRYAQVDRHPLRIYELITTLNDANMLALFEHHALRDAAFVRPAESFVTLAAFWRIFCIIIFFFLVEVALPQTINFLTRRVYYPNIEDIPFILPLILLLFSLGALCLVYDDAKYSARTSVAHRSAALYSTNPLVADTQSRVSLWHMWISIVGVVQVLASLAYWFGSQTGNDGIFTLGMHSMAFGHLMGIFIFVWVYLDATCIIAIYRPRSRGLFSSDYKPITYLVARREQDRFEDHHQNMLMMNAKLQKLEKANDAHSVMTSSDFVALVDESDELHRSTAEQLTVEQLMKMDENVQKTSTGGTSPGSIGSRIMYGIRSVLFVPLRMMMMVEAVFIETLKFLVFLVLTTLICGIALTNVYNLSNILDPAPLETQDSLLDTSGAAFTLFWAMFGLVDPSLFYATPFFQQIANYDNGTRWGFAIWGFYLAIVSVLLINLIIALLTIAATVVDERLPAKVFRRGIRRIFSIERAPSTSFFTGPFLGVIFFGYIVRFFRNLAHWDVFSGRTQHPSFSPRVLNEKHPQLFNEKEGEKALAALNGVLHQAKRISDDYISNARDGVSEGSHASMAKRYTDQKNHGLTYSRSHVFTATVRKNQANGNLEYGSEFVAKQARNLAQQVKQTPDNLTAFFETGPYKEYADLGSEATAETSFAQN